MSTQAPPKIVGMINRLRELLKKDGSRDIELTIADEGYVEEGGWVYLIVTPAEDDVQAHRYVNELSEFERKLRAAVGDEQILLVPAVPD